MYSWITIAEWSALIFSVVLIVNVSLDADNTYIRQRVVKSTYLSVFFSISFTLLSTYSLLYIDYLPIILVDIITLIYFLALPIPYVFCLRYAQCLRYFKTSENAKLEKWINYWIPYLLYAVFILSNVIFHHVYEISATGEYMRRMFYQSPYLIGVLYFIAIVITLFRCHKVIGRRGVVVLLSTLILCLGLVIMQFIATNLMLLGTVNMIIAITIHLNIQNSNKEIDRRTGLLNRDVLLYRLHDKIHSKTDFSIYLFSIRDFKNINERIGLRFGDFVLEEIAVNLINIFGRENVFRYKGDEFAVIITERVTDVERKIEDAVSMFLSPFSNGGITSSISMVYARVDYPLFGDNIKSLISAVDYSVATAKKGDNDQIAIYDMGIRKKMKADLNMQAKIKSSIENRDIVVHYQPIYSVSKDDFVAAEALVRMRNDDRSLIPPNDFIEIAEKTGLIIDLTYLILEKVCKDLREMDTNGEVYLRSVSVNFPYIQFLQSDVVEQVQRILFENNIEPKRIKIEITERTLISNHHTINDVIDKLQKLGFKLEVDDFGIEYSNLSLLLRIPFDILKVDRSLILEVLKSEENKEFFKNLLKGIRAINKLVIVEGIETQEQVSYMKECGVDYIQGYYFSRPLAPKDIEIFLKDKKSIDKL